MPTLPGLAAESPIAIPVSRTLDSNILEESAPHGQWLFECHGFWHNVALIVPSLLFVLYLAFQAKKSFVKLSNGRSYIMISYYGTLWLISLLNLAWCSLQGWECGSGNEVAWNILSLLTKSGMLFLEAIYVFGFGVPLFVDSIENPHHKWGLWVVHRLVLTAVYGFILFLYHSKWRERLPARPAFYKYITIMFTLNAIALLACALTGRGANFGFWLYGATIVCYHAFYLPLIYVTFLADFLQEEGLHLENAYYSEMKDAGFFDVDWD
ncbi:protein CANDIDATE G-PROTEIN COUPLED RECEPTOR 2-like isoform X2 [Tripterygium wilfordii]|uniref:protein CANDIDATE G-PROTEIN COUPLED RECEPTOR 2-like isoform X2 n=1 Tax=Tripterygium wilfordii TaxID=458696 RepID=UPI0018F8039C|nr:protein CANDIDATE G-PROTEIN COUPLED RECEPTOR 2-like isoform X2 [Tripterygium wilfordii]